MNENKNIPLSKRPNKTYWKYFLLSSYDFLTPLFFPEKSEKDIKSLMFKEFVCIINIETSSYCNRKCLYCPVSLDNSRKKQSYIKEEIFNKLLSDLKSINYSSTISFNLYNEPLADKNIYRRIKEARIMLENAFLMFNSNGDYLNSLSLNKLSDSGLNAIYVTLHPSSNKKYKINERKKEFHHFFQKINIKDYEIIEISETSSLLSTVYYNGMKIQVMANDWFRHGNSRAGEIDFLNDTKDRTLPCARPTREFTVSYNGSVFPCCQFFPDSKQNKKYIVGNILTMNIFDIYFSRILVKWRKDLFVFGKKDEPCNTCRDVDFSEIESLDNRMKVLEHGALQQRKELGE